MRLPLPERAAITGLVLAGGRATRMGGEDKGLLPLDGQPLALHVLTRLQPQVAHAAISANRNLERYRALGVPVWPDALDDFPGPLAGMLAGLRHCATPWLAVVPCDSPRLPLDLVERLARGAYETQTDIAVAALRENSGALRREPVFCLLRTTLADSLERFLCSGGRRVGEWMARHGDAHVTFGRAGDVLAFANANTPADLLALSARARP